jgi:hypothetical protein
MRRRRGKTRRRRRRRGKMRGKMISKGETTTTGRSRKRQGVETRRRRGETTQRKGNNGAEPGGLCLVFILFYILFHVN